MRTGIFTRWLGPESHKRLIPSGGTFLLLSLLVILLPYVYVSAEHTFYSNDPAYYQNLASDAAADFRASPVWAINSVMVSLANQYNRIFTVPLVPLLLV